MAKKANLAAEFDDWRRECGVCAVAREEGRLARFMLGSLVGPHDLNESAASALLANLVTYTRGEFVGGVTSKAHGVATGKPWRHLTDADESRVRKAWADAIADSLPNTSERGACGMCGRSRALGDWYDAPHTLTWPDGSRVAFCASCAGTWDRLGGPTFIDDLRRVGVEAATGSPVSLGDSAPDNFRLFAESKAADPAGLEEPWSWSEGLTAFIEKVWTWQPDCAPADRHDEFVQRRRDAYAAMAAQARETEARQDALAW
ncbi:hypothetical protein [Microbacterium sp. NPDC058389]|uniref:hypothetical protein n=1 Tax=Microbacterium sp. NPDC058389 TaxID=3346475 RepID=UPI00366A4C1C